MLEKTTYSYIESVLTLNVRISKTVADTEYKYTLNGTQIVSQEWDDKLMLFFYDESGFPIGYAYRTTSMVSSFF